MIDNDTLVTNQELMLCLGIKKSQLSTLERSDVIKRKDKNQYWLVDSLRGYRDYQRKGGNVNAKPNGDGEIIDFNEQRARKTKLEADALELVNQTKAGRFKEISEVTADIDDAMAVVSRILGDLKLNIGRHAPQLPNRALDLIEKECAKALTAICELDETYQEAEAEYIESVEANVREV